MIQPVLQNKLLSNNIPAGSPGWKMVEAARLLPALPTAPNDLFGDTPHAAARKLMQAFYDYGRIHFTWTSTSTGAAAAPGLLTGAATSCACATFNNNFKMLLEICGFNNVQNKEKVKRFITHPDLECIDSKWRGNVATAKKSSAEFKAFIFSKHYWLSIAGQDFDVCFNRTFSGAVEWLNLKSAPAKDLTLAKAKPDQLFVLAQGELPTRLPYADFALMLNTNGSAGWPLWKLILTSELKSNHLGTR